MAFGREDAKLLFKIKTDSSEAESAFDRLGVGSVALGSAIGTALGSVAVDALAAMSRAAVSAGTALFDLAKSTAEYGSEIKDASDKTGLSATALSALKIAADQSGASLEELTGPIAKFNKLAGEAAAGSEQAAEKLKQFGLEPQDAVNDLDGALEKVFKRIVNAPSQIEQTRLATEAFGKSGANLLPVLKSFDGNMEALIDRAREMGVVFDDEAANAADEFGDTLDSLHSTVKGLGMTFAREFIPQLTGGLRDIQRWLSANRDNIQQWGQAFGAAISKIRSGIEGFVSWWSDNNVQFWIERYLIFTTGGVIGDPFSGPKRSGAGDVAITRGGGGASAEIPGGSGGIGTGGRRSRSGPKADTEGDAQIRLLEMQIEEAKKKFKELADAAAEAFRLSGNTEAYRKTIDQLSADWMKMLSDVSKEIEAVENRQAAAGKKGMQELALLQAEQLKRFQENAKVIEEIDGEATNIRIKYAEEFAQRELEIYKASRDVLRAELQAKRDDELITEAEYQKALFQIKIAEFDKEKFLIEEILKMAGLSAEKRIELEQRLKIAAEERQKAVVEGEAAIKSAMEDTARELENIASRESGEQGISKTGTGAKKAGGERGGVFGAWTDSWLNFIHTFSETAPTLKSMMGDVAGMIQGAFGRMAQGVGSLVENWVLMGETGPGAMRKLLAATLAALAAEAAVRAIFELAMGFASLFFNPAEAAAHFTAAALFGSIAVGSALAGRAIAGDSFKKQSQTGATGANTQGSRSSAESGAYSSLSPVTVAMNANKPGGGDGYVVIRDKTSGGMFDQLFEMAWNNNGKMRRRLNEAFGT